MNEQQPKKFSASIEPCYCGEEDHRQVELYELDVPLRLTAKFKDVKFHMTVSDAEALAHKTNGGASHLGRQKNSQQPEPKGALTSNEGDTTMAKTKITKYAGPTENPSVQKMLARIQKRTADNPLKDKDLKGQYLKRIARRLGFAKMVVMEQREDVGLVFFGKEVKA